MGKLKRKRRRIRKDGIPFSHVRKQIPRPGTAMTSKKDYTRHDKHKNKLEEE